MENTTSTTRVPAMNSNLKDYESLCNTFNWANEKKSLDGLPGGKGLNIAYEAIERHAKGKLKNTIAIRCIQKDRTTKDFTYHDLHQLSSRFANVLTNLGVKKGERIFTLTGRIPELYIAALGTLKKAAVFCPLFSVFGPEPVFQRLSKGDATLLVTTKALFEKKVSQLLDKLPSLRFILLTDEESHINNKVLSLPRLMEEAYDEFFIPHTRREDAHYYILPVAPRACRKALCMFMAPC